jgi:hypothetical protein
MRIFFCAVVVFVCRSRYCRLAERKRGGAKPGVHPKLKKETRRIRHGC